MGSLLTFSIGATAIADTLTEAVASYQSAMQSSDRQERINGFRRAELLFRKAIDDSGGTANGDLSANLGTACLSGEQIGPAIVAYRKALHLNPQHDQSRKNLAYARDLLRQVQGQQEQYFAESWFFCFDCKDCAFEVYFPAEQHETSQARLKQLIDVLGHINQLDNMVQAYFESHPDNGPRKGCSPPISYIQITPGTTFVHYFEGEGMHEWTAEFYKDTGGEWRSVNLKATA